VNRAELQMRADDLLMRPTPCSAPAIVEVNAALFA
jgi:hypothetical protein